MPKISSRIALSITAAISGAAAIYLLQAWGLIPPPVTGESRSILSDLTGLLALGFLAVGWIMIFRRRPQWRRTEQQQEKTEATEKAQE